MLENVSFRATLDQRKVAEGVFHQVKYLIPPASSVTYCTLLCIHSERHPAPTRFQLLRGAKLEPQPPNATPPTALA